MAGAILGLDVGGANLKAVHSSGRAVLEPFELWKRPGDLAAALAAVCGRLPSADGLSVTMTGELCDCFPTKRYGVYAILDAVEAVAAGRPVRVWTTEGGFTNAGHGRAEPLRVASANWHALATFAGRFLPDGAGVLLDVGSTTTDVIPIIGGKPAAGGRTDPERLSRRELVYTGVTRSPVCALLGVEGAAEFFATTRDVYLVLGMLAEDPTDRNTADGRPATRAAARARLARMLCADEETSTPDEVEVLARRLCRRQAELLRRALEHVAAAAGTQARSASDGTPPPGPVAGAPGLRPGVAPAPRALVLAGAGEFLARLALELWPGFAAADVISLGARLGEPLSQAACALAVCQLAAEEGDISSPILDSPPRGPVS
jgi:probable H4MPT-linked C1 transfer pathway protein